MRYLGGVVKVLVILHNDLVPPEGGYPTKKAYLESDTKTEYDVVKALKKLKHEVKVQGVADDLRVIRQSIDEFKPNIVFNLLEEFAGEALYDHNVVGYLELLQVKYTGSNPRGLMLARDKAISKKILSYHRIPTPQFLVFKKNKPLRLRKKTKYPLFVKTLNEEASLGISQDSIVNNDEQLLKRVHYLHEKYETDVIAETYIKGREFYVGVVGNEVLKVLPVWELFFTKSPEGTPKIATSRVKWDFKYRERHGIKTGPAKGLSPELEKKIKSVCKRAYRALELSGYARMDLRLHEETGELFLIEANPNPDIGDNEDLAASAAHQKMSYPQLIKKLLHLGTRWTTT